MQLAPSQIFCRLGIAAIIAVSSAPSHAQPPAGATLPYDAAQTRLKPSRTHSIYSGQQTPKGAYPFVVALIQSEADDTEAGIAGGHYCGGSLIAERWVITGAQCAMTDQDGKKVAVAPDKIDVYAGSVNFKDGKRIKVKRVILHPQYDNETFNNDVALLELADDAPSNLTSTIALATPQVEMALAGVGKTVIAAGWGEIENGERPLSLRHVEMDILDSQTCNANIIKHRVDSELGSWAKLLHVQFALPENIVRQVRALIERNTGKVVNDNMICSGRVRTTQDTCGGDNGGPIFATGADGRFALVGITSWGEGCGLSDKGLFGIYARVSRYDAWVQQTAK